MRLHRDLFKHSSVYAFGEILARLASLLMLPIYTRFLRPADYGIIAIIDLTTGLLAIVVGGGLASAVSRFHFDTDDEDRRRTVWWTGLAFVAAIGGLIVLPAWLAAADMARWTLGESVSDGGHYYALALATMWLGCVEQIPLTYFRVRKWSGRFVSLSMFRLGLNVALNVSLLTAGWGVHGILWGNLATGAVVATVSLGILLRDLGSFRFDSPLLRRLLAFGTPLILTALLSTLMHQADRWILNQFASMEDVGTYSLAYRVGQGVNQVCLLPFASIWGVLIYEVAAMPNAREVFARVFEFYTRAAAWALLGASLFSRLLLALLTTEEYAAGADVLPVICLAYLLFGLQEHFRVPVLLQKKTLSFVPVYIAATVVNLAANFTLVPMWGGMGAAWATVATFFAYSAIGLWRYRKFDKYPYPFGRCTLVVGGMMLTYLICRLTTNGVDLLSIFVAGSVWLLWAVVLFARPVWQWFCTLDQNPSDSRFRQTCLSPEA